MLAIHRKNNTKMRDLVRDGLESWGLHLLSVGADVASQRSSFHDNSMNASVNTGVSSYLSFSFHVKRFPILDVLPTLHLSFSPGLLKIRTYSSCGSPDSTVGVGISSKSFPGPFSSHAQYRPLPADTWTWDTFLACPC